MQFSGCLIIGVNGEIKQADRRQHYRKHYSCIHCVSQQNRTATINMT